MQTFKRLSEWYFSRDALPYWSILVLDCVFAVFSGLLAYAVHHGTEETSRVLFPLMVTLCAFLICFVVGFRIFHTYQGIIRFSSFSDLMRVSGAVVVAITLVWVFQWILGGSVIPVAFSAADIILTGLFLIAMMWTVRIWVKTLYENSVHPRTRSRSFILGIRKGGVALAKNIRSSEDSAFKVVGFVSPGREPTDHTLLGLRIHPFDETLPDLMGRERADTLLVSPLSMDVLRSGGEIVNRLIERGVRIMVMPGAREWDGRSDLRAIDLRPVDVEDLLPRERIEVDMKAAADLLHDRVVLITGAAGSIGSEIVRQVASYLPSRLVLVDQAETPMHDIRLMMRKDRPGVDAETVVADITDRRIMERLFREYRPSYVFHAAAYKHVPMMEDNPYESVINNVYGTKVMADLAVRYGADKFVMVSTDKAVNPTNVMGCSKRICEIYVQSLDKAIKEGKVSGRTRFVTTRFGNVLGSNGSVIPIFQEQIRNGGPVTVTHPDIIRYFMLIPEACKLVIEAGTMGEGGEIYVFDMGEPVRIADLARKMISLSGAKDVEIRFTGLRDGEKLYEEVLNDKEITVPTFHPKIKAAKVREYDYSVVDRTIGELIETAPESDDMGIVRRMKLIVPEFRSRHSKYELIDREMAGMNDDGDGSAAN